MIKEANLDSNSLEIWTHNLTKHYGKKEKIVKAVNGIDILMKPGIHGFLGPNGAGKTSTINMLLGIINITEGEAKVRGNIAGSSELKKVIGYLPQDPALYLSMTGKTYLEHVARLSGKPPQEAGEKAQELLQRLNITEAQDRAIRTYSGGMKQRIALASALIGDPRLLILDEPTSSLDPIGRNEIIKYIKELSQHMSIFVSSHVLSEIEQMCDTITILNKGKIVLTDSIENIKKIHAKSKKTFFLDTNNNKQILDVLKSKKFIGKAWIDDNDNMVYFTARENDKVEMEIPQFLAGNKIGLKKFSQKEFSLQDVFLEIIEKDTNTVKEKEVKENDSE